MINLDPYFYKLPNFGTLVEIRCIMGKNTSVSLGNHFEAFVENSISTGRFQNASEVIRAGLRLLEEEEAKIVALRSAIQEGIESGIATNFDPEKQLEMLRLKKKKSNG
jgi:antitoxin ParD1/3/4